MTKISNEDLMQAVLDNPHLSNRALARYLGVNESVLRRRRARLAAKGFAPEHDMTKTVPDGYKVKGVSTYYNSIGKPIGQWVKSTIDQERQFELLKEGIKAMAQELPKLQPTTIYNEHEIEIDLMAVYPLGDPHIGMLAWDKETGDSWDLSIAEQIFMNMFKRIVSASPRCAKAVILNLGDYFHSDNFAGVTTRSHHSLDMDGRYPKMIHVGVRLFRWFVQCALEHHETVHIMSCQGNHDDIGSIFLNICLANIYENDPRVTVDISPSTFHYIRHGKTLIGAHHGHTCKMDRLPGVMACDRAEEWGQSRHRYWLTGHIHHDSKIEQAGCIVESFRTIAAKDAYGAAGGWRAGRDIKSIIYHKEFGEIERHVVNIDQVRQGR